MFDSMADGGSSGDGPATTQSGTAPGSDGDGGASGASADSGSDDGDPPKLDVGSPDGGPSSCGCELTYIWIANAGEGTVSKINTRTLEEEGRYLTRPDGEGDPSRTSVNLEGDVAVANRRGGLAKFRVDPDDCVESNGMPGIQTSTGRDDVLPWDVEECRVWYTDFPTTNQRPVAWTGGTATEDGMCDATAAKVWTVTSTVAGLPGLGGPGGVIAYLVNGEDGSIEEQIAIDQFSGAQHGAYGGAVDAAGNLYFTSIGFIGGTLARINRSSFDVTTWTVPPNVGPYGITLDHKGRVWLSSINLQSGAARFDPSTETWDVVTGFIDGSGVTQGPDDHMYITSGNGVSTVHMDTLALGPKWTTDAVVKGVAFDADHMLWAVTWVDEENPGPNQGVAFKIDPLTMSVDDFYDGLTFPYTYSDMTGNALGSVTCPPEG